MSEVLGSINDLLSKNDAIPCRPRNKRLLYHRLVLSKLSWHSTISNLSKTWIVENIDSLVSRYVRQWLEGPISATLSSLLISKSKYGLSLILLSIKFTQCQVVIRNALKSSPNSDINHL